MVWAANMAFCEERGCFQVFIYDESITNFLDFTRLTQYMLSVQNRCDLLQSERVALNG